MFYLEETSISEISVVSVSVSNFADSQKKSFALQRKNCACTIAAPVYLLGSNLCLHRFLGAAQPEIMMDAMGGREGTRERLQQAADRPHDDDLFKDEMRVEDLHVECIAQSGGIKLLVVGKITSFGEGCACMIGGISKAVLSRLREGKDEIVLIDAEAGLEHPYLFSL